MADPKKEQIEITERLQLLWLRRMERLFDDGTITSTDMATLQRFLSQNGWTVDPARLPEGLKNKLTSAVKFDDDIEDDGVVGKIA